MSKYLDTSGLEEVSDIVSDRLSTKVDKITGKGLSEANFTTAEKQKLAEIDLSNYIQLSQKGTTNGVATLDSNGKVPSFQLPDDNIVGGYYDTTSQKFYKESTYNTKTTGDSSKLYVDLNSSKVYRWNGTVWIDVASTLTLGIGSTNAYPGDLGNANAVAINNLASSIGDLSELDTVDKSNVVSAINEKQAALTFDDTPTEGSSNPVTSGGVYDELQGKSNTDHTHNTFSGKFVEGTGNDFNNFTKNGIWIIPNIAEVFSSNAPATWENGFLLVFRGSENMIFQLFLGSYTNNMYFRCYRYGAGWAAWRKVSAT